MRAHGVHVHAVHVHALHVHGVSMIDVMHAGACHQEPSQCRTGHRCGAREGGCG